jgi:hypothetical protein
MVAFPMSEQSSDPRKLRALLERVSDLARSHDVSSVMVGLAAPEGDLQFPEFVDFLQSALRVEDGIFRMTRERAVLHLADVDAPTAQVIVGRLLEDFIEQYPTTDPPSFQLGYFEVAPEADDLTVKRVLKAIFASEANRSMH